MSAWYACGSSGHVSRRSFLGSAMGGIGLTGALGPLGFSGMVQGAQTLEKRQKHCVVFWLAGGVSQLETWDPKPGTDTGGPFQAIPTSVPGVHICELLPCTALQMHHLALIRGINTAEGDHGKGAQIMLTGRKEAPGFEYPYLGSAFSSLLTPPGSPLPGYVNVTGGGSGSEAAFLGPQHAPVNLNEGKSPANLALPGGLTAEADIRRRNLRRKLGAGFAKGRKQSELEVYNGSFDQAAALLAKKELFDLSTANPKDLGRYGAHDFGKQVFLARRLIEAGVAFAQVTHSNYDTHSENFNFHIEQLGEFDLPFATFLGDLHDRGLLEHTLVIVMCEFGRTPRINHLVGRDHWGTAWSIAVGGAGIKGGAVVGKTNENGTKVIDREVNGGHLFHTYYRALGLDPTVSFDDNGRPIDKADPAAAAITEVLA